VRKSRMPLGLAAALVATMAPAGPPTQGAGQGDHYMSPWRTPWTYEGPRGSDHWAELDPLYAACGGKAQSPIDIRATHKSTLPALRVAYKADVINYVTNNGHTIRVNYPPGNGNFLFVGNRGYELTQFHFHRPSEEYIHGKPYDMVLHLMHVARDGEVLGLAVLLKSGQANAVIAQLFEHMPRTEGQTPTDGLRIDPAGMLPGDLRSYYTYVGSQTAPPCTEQVRWIILKIPATVSTGEIAAFAKLYPHDARALQPLNNRIIEESR